MGGGMMALCLCSPVNAIRSSPLSHRRFRASSSPLPNSAKSKTKTNLTKTLFDIHTSGVIACLRAPSVELAIGAAQAALSGGIKVLEVVMSNPGVFEILHQLVEDHPMTTLGVGTILNTEDAKDAVKAGAKFLMSPAMIRDVLDEVQGGDVLYIPGAMTPTEILSAHNAGAKIVKVYPVSALGGVEYISALKKPFPHIPMVASQGIGIGSIEEFIARGASSVVLSDAIFDKEAIARGDFDAISERAQHVALLAHKAVKRLQLVQERVMEDRREVLE